MTNGTKTVTAEKCKKFTDEVAFRRSEETDSRKIEASGRDSPEILEVEEENLSRLKRTRLAQLRSGYCPLLNSYLCRIDKEIQNSCIICNKEDHTLKHLFECPNNPASLKIRDLWNNPNEAMNF